MRLSVLKKFVEDLIATNGGGSDVPPDILERVEALEEASTDPSSSLEGTLRPLGEMFTLPDATKDYFVTYDWVSTNNANWEVILYHGVPDGAGWFVSQEAVDILSQVATPGQHLEVKGKIPAGHSVMMLVNGGNGGVTAVGIEVPIV